MVLFPAASLKFAHHCLRPPNVGALRALVAGAEEKHQQVAPPREIEALARPVVYPHFADAAADGANIAEMAAPGPRQARDDRLSADDILEAAKLRGEFARLLNPNRFHKRRAFVAHKLQLRWCLDKPINLRELRKIVLAYYRKCIILHISPREETHGRRREHRHPRPRARNVQALESDL
jgi:hypothetical protein